MSVDFATLGGLVIGITVVLLAILTESDIAIFINIPGLLIVAGGTFAATLIKFPLSGVFISLPLGLKTAFSYEKDRPRDYIEQAVALVKRGRKKGLVSLDGIRLRNPFFTKGVQLCADGRDLDYIRNILTREMAMSIQRDEMGANVFAAIGEAAPAFGMFGTLVGLVQMLSSMNDPTTIGRGMAVALLTTLYGTLIANLLALPIADKLAEKSRQEKETRSLIIECVFQIQQLQNPTSMREVLEPYLPEKQRGGANGGAGYTAGKEVERKRSMRRPG